MAISADNLDRSFTRMRWLVIMIGLLTALLQPVQAEPAQGQDQGAAD